MTTITIPAPANDAGDSLRWVRLLRVQQMCRDYLGREPGVILDGETLTAVFTPDLSQAEAATLTAIVRVSGIGVVTPAEYAAVTDDVAALRTFLRIASPTNAQAVAAIKSLIRVLGAIVRD